jgi:hypothetical protein
MHKNFFFVTRYPSLTKKDDFPLGCAMRWNHFGSGQSKGRWDGARATMKQTLQVEQIQPNSVQLHNATNVVAYLKHNMGHQHLAYDGARRRVRRCFYEVKISDVNKVD